MFGRKKAPDKLPSLGLDKVRAASHQGVQHHTMPSQQLQQHTPQPHMQQQNNMNYQAQQHPSQTQQHVQQPNTMHQVQQHMQQIPQEQHQSQQLSAHVMNPHQDQSQQYKQMSQFTTPSHEAMQQLQRVQEQPAINREQKNEIVQRMKRQSPEEEEQGYFKQLVKSVTEDNSDVDKLSAWYENKFLPNDIVFQMREYWEKQQPELLLKSIRGDLKQDLMKKTGTLHQLEGEWQDIYFKLLSKEDEIRKEERELKATLSEFMDAFKRSLKDRKK